MQKEETFTFPDVFIEVLDHQAVEVYFQNLELCGEVECRVKAGATIHAENTLDFESCVQAWKSQALYSVQFIYQWEDAIWCDTLSQADGGVRLVRIKRLEGHGQS